MKLVTFIAGQNSQPRLGVVLGDQVLDLNSATNNKLPSQMLSFLEGGEACIKSAQKTIQKPDNPTFYFLKNVRLKAPLPHPPALKDFFAFEEHAVAGSQRRGEPLPPEWYEIPAYYKGNHREIYGPEDDIPWPYYTRKLDYECEIACVVGKKGKNLTPEEAADTIFGYMIFNDFSARDIQKKEMMLRMGPTKGKDFANAFGPYLVTADEVNPLQDFSMQARVNGELWSEGHFKNQFWGFPLMISHVSQEETIYPGDIFGSGTFYKGCGLDLNRWIQPGDTIELEVPKLGILRNRIGTPKEQRELNYNKKDSGQGFARSPRREGVISKRWEPWGSPSGARGPRVNPGRDLLI
ncbi:MAG: fumarylacetoacetate hydrolase family protein [Elusimicrobia bacterium]|nr:fumarylacetoacetate hydrolase family protein [Elusimicrobiota bacterium]